MVAQQATRSLTVSLEEAIRLRNALAHRGVDVLPPRTDSELFAVQTGPFDLVVFKTGTVTYRDTPAARELLRGALGTESGYDFFLGSDEAGKGEWYGPLVVVATAGSPDTFTRLRELGVRDSKALTREGVSKLAQEIQFVKGLRWKEVILVPAKYNELYDRFRSEGKTLNDLLAWAHSAAHRSLLENLGEKRAKIVIDEFAADKMDLRLRSVDRERVTVVQRPRGEEDPMVATSSILAKWIFERETDRLSAQFLIDLHKVRPDEVPAATLRQVAKLHFQNVASVLSRS